jgi:hypothetical protein
MSVYAPYHHPRIPEPVFMKLGMYVMAPEPNTTVYFINPFHPSVCLCPRIVARQFPRQRIHATIEELLDAVRGVTKESYFSCL